MFAYIKTYLPGYARRDESLPPPNLDSNQFFNLAPNSHLPIASNPPRANESDQNETQRTINNSFKPLNCKPTIGKPKPANQQLN